MTKRQYMRDGTPVRRQLIATFNGEYQAEMDGSTLHIYTDNPTDVGIYLLASFEGKGYIGEQ